MKKISYSHSWEDYSLLNKAFKIKNTDTVLGIASAGESIFSIALDSPKQIIAVDSNLSQIYLVKLKIISIKHLDYSETLKFFGFEKSNNRIYTYDKLKKYLNKNEIKYWDSNLSLIKNGIIHSGKLEKYFNLFRKYFIPFIISKKNLKKYLLSSNIKEQEKNYKKYWQNWRWKFFHSIFFSKLIMRNVGRDKGYFSNSEIKKISDYYFKKAEFSFKTIPIKESYFHQYLMLGRIVESNFLKDHPYLNKKNYQMLKKNLNKIILLHDSVDNYLNRTNLKFDKIHLSDIFEGFSQADYEELLKIINTKSNKNTIICYWNNLVERHKHDIKDVNYQKKISEELFNKDKTALFYSKFIVEKIN